MLLLPAKQFLNKTTLSAKNVVQLQSVRIDWKQMTNQVDFHFGHYSSHL